MNALEAERRTLEKAEQDIAEGERRVTRVSLLLETLRRDGLDTGEAEALLRMLEETLENWRGHRALILQRVDELARRERR